MSTKENLTFFQEVIFNTYELFYWNYDADFQLIDTNSTFPDVIGGVGFSGHLRKHLDSGKRTPIIFETNLGLVWIVGFQFEGDVLKGVSLFGSAFTGRDTAVLLLKKLDGYELSVKFRSIITKSIREMPVLAINTLTRLATMLHYTLNREKIISLDVIYSLPEGNEEPKSIDMLPNEHNGIWLNEQQMCKMFAEGNPNYISALERSAALSSGLQVELGDSLRKHKNNALVLLTLCSRSCITGGLNPSVAYDLNDYYAQAFEECKTLGEISNLTSEMVKEYVRQVQLTKKSAAVSPAIQSICYYIQQHLAEPLSIGELAKRVGYTEYYFSHKFKKETGVSVNEYISNEKINKAKLLLSGTNESIQDISDSLAYSNRSYFYSCFQKKVGLSPTEYRKQYGKL